MSTQALQTKYNLSNEAWGEIQRAIISAEGQTPAKNDWAEVVKKVGNTSLEGVKHLEKAKDDLADVVAKVAAHNRSVEHLEKEIKKLKKVHNLLQSLLKLDNSKGLISIATLVAGTWAVAKYYYESVA